MSHTVTQAWKCYQFDRAAYVRMYKDDILSIILHTSNDVTFKLNMEKL